MQFNIGHIDIRNMEEQKTTARRKDLATQKACNLSSVVKYLQHSEPTACTLFCDISVTSDTAFTYEIASLSDQGWVRSPAISDPTHRAAFAKAYRELHTAWWAGQLPREEVIADTRALHLLRQDFAQAICQQLSVGDLDVCQCQCLHATYQRRGDGARHAIQAYVRISKGRVKQRRP